MKISFSVQSNPPVEPSRQEVRIPLPRPATNAVVTYLIMAVTIGFFILQQLSSVILGADYPLAICAKVNSAIQAGQFWRLLTPALIHANLIHIGFNMYALYVIGRGLERHYGHARYLGLYVLSAMGGNVMSFLLSNNPSVGASTAIFGLVAAEGIFIFRNRFLFGENTRSMLVNIGSIILVNLLLGLSPGIDNWGHLGGLIAGLGFAWFAGPALKIEGLYPNLKFQDLHSGNRFILVAAVEVLILSGLTILRLG